MFSISSSDNAALDKAADILRNGGVAIIPTDTVYGLAAHPGHPEAVARLQTIKARENPKPVALLIDAPETLARFFQTSSNPQIPKSPNLQIPNLPPIAQTLAKRYWPGALTLVLETPNGTEGFRVPNHAFCRALLARCGGALRVTSANLTGQMPATSAAEALAALGLTADLLVDDGPSPGGLASTVLRIAADNTPALLREGAIPFFECQN